MNGAKGIVYGAARTSGCWPDGDGGGLPVRDIHGECSCTWVPSVYSRTGGTLMVRKYAHTACRATSWHRRRAAAMQS